MRKKKPAKKKKKPLTRKGWKAKFERKELAPLALLFREVLEQIPTNKAEELSAVYRAGKPVVLALFPSRYGMGCKTAISWATPTAEQLKTWMVEAALDRKITHS
jgi:hypothetical protein